MSDLLLANEILQKAINGMQEPKEHALFSELLTACDLLKSHTTTLKIDKNLYEKIIRGISEVEAKLKVQEVQSTDSVTELIDSLTRHSAVLMYLSRKDSD